LLNKALLTLLLQPKNNQKTKTETSKTKTLKNESGDVSRPRLQSREPQLWM